MDKKLIETLAKGGTPVMDFFGLMLGKKLGEGAFRSVYEFNVIENKSSVIKIEIAERDFCNIFEWDAWYNLKDTELVEYLAPCHFISPCGLYLIQERTEPITKAQLPPKIPRFFTDTSIKNWGLLNGKPVCHDYANNTIYSKGDMFKLVKADWW